MPLSEKQIQSFNESDARINIWVGAVRSGKSYTCDLKFIDLLKNGPPGACMIIGVNRDSIQRNVLIPIYKMLGFDPPGSKTNETKLYGRNVYFVGAHDEGAVRRIQGATLAFAYVDECVCIPQPFFNMLLSRLSVKGAQLIATCNPEGPAHFIKKDYIDRADELDLKYWNFRLEDNPSLDPTYVESLKREYTGMWHRRYVLGEWALSTGIVYDSLTEDNFYTDEMVNPNYYVAAIDYGTVNPTACLLAGISPKQWPQICIQKEYYYSSAKEGIQKTDAQLADDIKEFLGHVPLRSLYVDPSAASLKLELRNRDLPVVDANNDVLFGIKMVSKFISQKNLLIHKSCTNLRDELHTYAWDGKAADRGEDKPVKKSDHCCDSLRYLVSTTFPSGDIYNPYDNMSIEQIRREVYGDTGSMLAPQTGGYY